MLYSGLPSEAECNEAKFGGPLPENLDPFFDIIFEWAPKLKKVYEAQEETRQSLTDV